MVFLKYKNGSILERSLLSTIQSFVANPSKMKIFLIMLVRSIIYFFLSFFSLIKRFYSKSWSANQNYVCILQICRLCGFSRVFFWYPTTTKHVRQFPQKNNILKPKVFLFLFRIHFSISYVTLNESCDMWWKIFLYTFLITKKILYIYIYVSTSTLMVSQDLEKHLFSYLLWSKICW